MKLLSSAWQWLQGLPFGDVWPKRTAPPALPFDGRTCALTMLRKYISELTFNFPGDYDATTGKYGPPNPFSIPEDSIHIEMADGMEPAGTPSIAFSPAEGKYEPIGLTAFLDESTRDKFGVGTVIQWQSEYTETFTLELWASSIAQRRSIIAGLESGLTPTEQMYGIRFRMPDYYMETVCFTPNSRTNIDDGDAARGRLKAQFKIEMRFNIVALVNCTSLMPSVVVDPDT